MFVAKLAELSVGINNRYKETEDFCRDYLSRETPALSLTVTEESLQKELTLTNEDISMPYAELLAVYRMLGERLPFFDGCIFHGAAIAYGGKAYLFTAPSGTGKTTHINYWKKAFGSEVSIVNGDKPILRYINGVPHACGTPWAGKENLHRNVCVPIGGICFLERGETDLVSPVSAAACVPKALSQMYMPMDPKAMEKTLSLLDRLLSDVPLWKLECTRDIHAAFVAKEAITGK